MRPPCRSRCSSEAATTCVPPQSLPGRPQPDQGPRPHDASRPATGTASADSRRTSILAAILRRVQDRVEVAGPGRVDRHDAGPLSLQRWKCWAGRSVATCRPPWVDLQFRFGHQLVGHVTLVSAATSRTSRPAQGRLALGSARTLLAACPATSRSRPRPDRPNPGESESRHTAAANRAAPATGSPPRPARLTAPGIHAARRRARPRPPGPANPATLNCSQGRRIPASSRHAAAAPATPAAAAQQPPPLGRRGPAPQDNSGARRRGRQEHQPGRDQHVVVKGRPHHDRLARDAGPTRPCSTCPPRPRRSTAAAPRADQHERLSAEDAADGLVGGQRLAPQDEQHAAPRQRPVINARNSQPMGDLLNACRLLKMPLRVRNVAKLHRPKVAMAKARAVFFSDAAVLPGHQGVDQRRAGQPGDQRAVLDRVPAPVAAPAQRLRTPIRRPSRMPLPRTAQASTAPGPRLPDPVGVQPAADQGDRRQRERHGPQRIAQEHDRADGSASPGAAAAGLSPTPSGRRARLASIGSAANTMMATRKHTHAISTPNAGSRKRTGLPPGPPGR